MGAVKKPYGPWSRAMLSNLRERGITERTDHRGIDEIQDILRHHAADDRQTQRQDASKTNGI